MDLTQRGLVNRRLRLSDGEITTKYVFPFWDAEWRVVFYLLDLFGRPPAILNGPIHQTRDGSLENGARLRDLHPLESVDPACFAGLFHFDPWWVFRGIGGVHDAWKLAILPANVAKPFGFEGRHWKIHDVHLDGDGERVSAINAKDEGFQSRMFTRANFDLSVLRPHT